MDICTNYSRVAIGSKRGDDARLIRLRCKLWTCEYCATVNRKQWLRRLVGGIEQLGGMWSFWTLTHDMQNTTLLQQRQHLSDAFNRLRLLIKRDYGRTIAYVRVLEIGANNTQRMHMHVLADMQLDAYEVTRRDGTTYWQDDRLYSLITRAGFGIVSDTRNVTSLVEGRPQIEQAVYTASYVAKYMSKQTAQVLYPKHTRRFSVSRGFPHLQNHDDFATDLEWQVVQQVSGRILAPYWSNRQHVVDVATGARVTSDDLVGDDELWRDPLLR